MTSSLFLQPLNGMVGQLLSDSEYKKVTIYKFMGGNAFLPFTSTIPPRVVYALLASAKPTLAITEETSSLVFAGVVFQYLDAQKKYIVHSEWLEAALRCGTTSLDITTGVLGGTLQFKHDPGSMKSPREDWVFYLPKRPDSSIPKAQVQKIFNGMYSQAIDLTTDASKSMISLLQNQTNSGKQLLESIGV